MNTREAWLKRHFRFVAFVALQLVVCSTAILAYATVADGSTSNAPVLDIGDILLCGEYHYRTVSNPDLTVYQLSRLGFRNAKQFQEKYGLKADNLIGPVTRNRVQDEYLKTFRAMPAPPSNVMLSVSSQIISTGGMALLRVCITNMSSMPIRLRGRLETDQTESDLIRLWKPSVRVNVSVCTREGGRIACGGWSFELPLCATDTVLRQNEVIVGRAILAKLKYHQDGYAHLTIRFMDASGTVHELKSNTGELPREGE